MKPKAKAKQKSKRVVGSKAATDSSIKASRNISSATTLRLYVQAGGRCEFDNCNKYLLEHGPTSNPGNFAEKAHIWAFKENGPRGASPDRPSNINQLPNLMLLCKDCHHEIDVANPGSYPVEVLRKFKQDHEERIFGLTGLFKDRDTVPIVLRGLIANRKVEISDSEMQLAVAPNYLRRREKIEIDLSQLPDTADSHYWSSAKTAIDSQLDTLARIRPRDNKSIHISIFALAAIPLLAYLGSKLSDKILVDLYQRHRNPESWNWRDGPGTTEFAFRRANDGAAGVALVINVSGMIPVDAVTSVASDCTLYELGVTGQLPTPLVLNTREDLNRFVTAYVAALESIRAAHPGVDLVKVFPAVPAPVAILIGRHLLPKIGPKLLIFDHDRRSGTFVQTITIG